MGPRDINDASYISQLESMPPEQREQILSHLDAASLLEASEVSRTINESISNHLWKEKFLLHFPHKEFQTGSDKTAFEQFKEAYQKDYDNLSRDQDVKKKASKIFSLVKEGDVPRLQEILANPLYQGFFQNLEFLNYRDGAGRNFVDWAAQQKYQPVLNFIYNAVSSYFMDENKIVDVAKRDGNDMTILHWAAYCRQPNEKIQELLDKGAVVEIRGSYDRTVLHCAALGGSLATFRFLFNKCENNDLLTTLGLDLLCCAACNDHNDMVNFLIEKNAPLNDPRRDLFAESLLHIAVANNNLNLVKALLAKKVDINASYLYYGECITPTSVAVERGNTTILKILLENNDKIADLSPSIIKAAGNGRLDYIKLLLEKVNFDDEGHNKEMLLDDLFYSAAENGQLNVVKYVVEELNLDVNEKYGRSPISIAASEGHLEVVKYLIEKNAILWDVLEKVRIGRIENPQKENAYKEIENIVKLENKKQAILKLKTYHEKYEAKITSKESSSGFFSRSSSLDDLLGVTDKDRVEAAKDLGDLVDGKIEGVTDKLSRVLSRDIELSDIAANLLNATVNHKLRL